MEYLKVYLIRLILFNGSESCVTSSVYNIRNQSSGADVNWDACMQQIKPHWKDPIAQSRLQLYYCKNKYRSFLLLLAFDRAEAHFTQPLYKRDKSNQVVRRMNVCEHLTARTQTKTFALINTHMQQPPENWLLLLLSFLSGCLEAYAESTLFGYKQLCVHILNMLQPLSQQYKSFI